MNGEIFASGRGKVHQNLFRTIGPVILLVEGKDKCDRCTGRNRQSGCCGECRAGTGITSSPKLRSAQARALQC